MIRDKRRASKVFSAPAPFKAGFDIVSNCENGAPIIPNKPFTMPNTEKIMPKYHPHHKPFRKEKVSKNKSIEEIK